VHFVRLRYLIISQYTVKKT